MKVEYLNKRISGAVTGYGLTLSCSDTANWANKPGASWPCSTIAGHKITVHVDGYGLCDYFGPDNVDGSELDAIISDHQPKSTAHLWPTWKSLR